MLHDDMDDMIHVLFCMLFLKQETCSGWRAGVPEGGAAAGPRARGAGAAGGGEGPRGDHLQHARPLVPAQWATCKCLTIMFNTHITYTEYFQ